MPTIKGIYVDGIVYNYEDANIAPNFQNFHKYTTNELVFYDGILYRCIKNHNSAAYFDFSKWTQINLAEYLAQNYYSIVKNFMPDSLSVDKPVEYDFSHINSDNYFVETFENGDEFVFNVEKNSEGIINKIINTTNNSEITIIWEQNIKQPLPYNASITLSSNWEGNSSPYSQTVSIEGQNITNKSYITLCPSIDQLNELLNMGVEGLNMKNDNGELTAYVIGTKPSTEITMQCKVEETI